MLPGPHHHNVTKSLSYLSYTYHTIASPLQQQLNYLTVGGDGNTRQVQVDRMSTSCLRSNRRRLDSLLVFGVSAAQGNFFNLLIHSARPTTIGLAQPSPAIHIHRTMGAPTLNCKSKLLQFRFHVFLFFCFWFFVAIPRRCLPSPKRNVNYYRLSKGASWIRGHDLPILDKLNTT